MNLIIISLLVLVSQLQVVELRCSHHKNCFACTQHKVWIWMQCKWCPLTSLCHSPLSLNNQCLKDQNILRTNKCLSRFHGQTKHYSPSEAFRLAKFSAIAYSDVPGQCMDRVFKDEDYVISKVITKECDGYFFEYDKPCAVVLAKSDRRREVIIAFRGTRGSKQVLDQILTVMTKHTAHFLIGGKVQVYFKHINGKLYSEVKANLRELLKRHPGYEVKVTGHSLGGATASLTSALLIHERIVKSDKLFLYTYGMPRVGNKRYAQSHDRIVGNSWRVVRQGDIIARLPRCFHGKCSLFNGPYHHGTKVLYTTSPMEIYSNYIICKGNEDSTSECKKRQRYKRGLIGNMMDKHREYFGIRIGTYCRDFIMKQ